MMPPKVLLLYLICIYYNLKCYTDVTLITKMYYITGTPRGQGNGVTGLEISVRKLIIINDFKLDHN